MSSGCRVPPRPSATTLSSSNNNNNNNKSSKDGGEGYLPSPSPKQSPTASFSLSNPNTPGLIGFSLPPDSVQQLQLASHPSLPPSANNNGSNKGNKRGKKRATAGRRRSSIGSSGFGLSGMGAGGGASSSTGAARRRSPRFTPQLAPQMSPALSSTAELRRSPRHLPQMSPGSFLSSPLSGSLGLNHVPSMSPSMMGTAPSQSVMLGRFSIGGSNAASSSAVSSASSSASRNMVGHMSKRQRRNSTHNNANSNNNSNNNNNKDFSSAILHTAVGSNDLGKDDDDGSASPASTASTESGQSFVSGSHRTPSYGSASGPRRSPRLAALSSGAEPRSAIRLVPNNNPNSWREPLSFPEGLQFFVDAGRDRQRTLAINKRKRKRSDSMDLGSKLKYTGAKGAMPHLTPPNLPMLGSLDHIPPIKAEQGLVHMRGSGARSPSSAAGRGRSSGIGASAASASMSATHHRARHMQRSRISPHKHSPSGPSSASSSPAGGVGSRHTSSSSGRHSGSGGSGSGGRGRHRNGSDRSPHGAHYQHHQAHHHSSSSSSSSSKHNRHGSSSGHRMSDSVTTASHSFSSGNGSGSSCHQCKSRRDMSNLIFCCNMFKRSTKDKKRQGKRHVCRKKYCDQCLMKFYHEQPPPQRQDPQSNWPCPACRGICCCAACRRQKAKLHQRTEPMRMSPATALAAGLVYFNNKEKFRLGDPAVAEGSNPDFEKAVRQLNNGYGPFKNTRQLASTSGKLSSGSSHSSSHSSHSQTPFVTGSSILSTLHNSSSSHRSGSYKKKKKSSSYKKHHHHHQQHHHHHQHH
eukprot:TRINITY_DN66595_c5_g5_i3.p1 TRINITY_DN66595_c5_g5~~TRINITY_DN66595_c5_g5_i3.p1  ORF type:complete len:803 (+),score=368.70 TRINITY_DN66595_c5_g5_i3:441-2849(+)